MILLRCSESQSGENFKTSADKRQGETMNLISVAMFALNVNVDGNSRQARVNGRSDCVGVLCRAVVCCAVSCCAVLCCAVLWRAVLCCGVVWCGVVW